MDTGVSLGRAAHRRLWEVVREVARDDVDLGGRLLRRFRDDGAFRLDSGAFAQFDGPRARSSLTDFLGSRRSEFCLAPEWVPHAALPDLQMWEAADLPLPVSHLGQGRPAWLATLQERKLVTSGPRGLRLSPRLRLHVWLNQEALAAPSGEISRLPWEAMKALRQQGRWHEAARWAEVLLETQPDLVDRHPALAITVVLGYTQSQNYAWLSRWFRALEERAHKHRVLADSVWKERLLALRAFVDIERGEPGARRPAHTHEGRFWQVLVSCWSDLYVGRYRRALRLLDFIQKKRGSRISWLDPLLLAWRAAALHYQEDYLASRECNLLAMRLAGQLGWRERELVMLRNYALSEFENGETAKALAILKGMANRHMLEHRSSALPGVYNLEALILNIRVRLGSGAWTNLRAQHLGVEAGVVHHVLYLIEGQAQRARRSNQVQVSENLFLQVEELAGKIGHPLARGNAVWNRARMAWCRGEADLALELLARAEALFTEMNQFTRQADMKCDRALLHLELAEFDLAEAEIRGAETLYGPGRKKREAALLQLLRLELLMRSAPESLEESHLDLITSETTDTMTRTAYAYAVVALGFALLDDGLSCALYRKEALDQVNRLLDPFITAHILDLGTSLRKRSRTSDELVSYWIETFPFKEAVIGD